MSSPKREESGVSAAGSQAQQPSASTETTEAPAATAGASVAQSSVAGDGLKCEWSNCGERCASPEQLYDHVCERHVGRKSTNNLQLTCQWGNCRTTTVKRDHITSHIRVHVPLKPHKCDFCGKAFKRPQDLKKHVKTHADDSHTPISPEPSRVGHGGGGGGYQGQARHVADLQALAATASGYYPDRHGLQGQAPVFPPYPNGAPNPSAYHGGSHHYQAGYATTFYPMPVPNHNAEYEVRKKATYDALNEFFGDIKARSIDPSMFHAVGQRLMQIQMQMPAYGGVSEYNGGTAVATAPTPLSQHYSLPLSNLKSKSDLQNIDQFLEQLQQAMYEHEPPAHAAAAGVAQAGSHYIHSGVNYRSSNSPQAAQAAQAAQASSAAHAAASAQVLPPLTSTAADTPALTPASSVLSYSPGSVHSAAAISPVSRSSIGSMYPTLPAVPTVADVGVSYTATSSAIPSALATSFDPADSRRRYSAGLLQRARVEKKSAESPSENLPRIDKLGVRSPSMSNVDPALCGGDEKSKSESPNASPKSEETTPKAEPEKPRRDSELEWLNIVRVLEDVRNLVKRRLENHEYEYDDEGTAASRQESDEQRHAESLYPVIRSLQAQQ